MQIVLLQKLLTYFWKNENNFPTTSWNNCACIAWCDATRKEFKLCLSSEITGIEFVVKWLEQCKWIESVPYQNSTAKSTSPSRLSLDTSGIQTNQSIMTSKHFDSSAITNTMHITILTSLLMGKISLETSPKINMIQDMINSDNTNICFITLKLE